MSSPNGSGFTLDRLTKIQARRTARIAGIFFVLTFISVAALPRYHSVFKDHSRPGAADDGALDVRETLAPDGAAMAGV